MTFRYEESDLLNSIGLCGEDWLDLEDLISQAKELVKLFIGNPITELWIRRVVFKIRFTEHGADINLQTTNSGRTIYHEVIANEVSDFKLIDRMVTLGALVNLTDVHGTTPFMDLVKNTDNAIRIHSDLLLRGKVRTI